MIHLTIRQMEYFEALAETLHFGRAARLVGVTQPALSAQIAELERRLGCRLFERDARTVRLTEHALSIRPRIERLLADIRELEAKAGGEREAMQGRFRLGVIPTIAPYFLPSVLPALKARFPMLSVELRESVTQTLVEETVAGQLDAIVAVVLGGTSLMGGRGTILGTILGTLTIAVIGNGLILMHISPFFTQIVTGAIILVAIFFASFVLYYFVNWMYLSELWLFR